MPEHRRWIRQRWPDYLFGRVMAAHEFISAADYDAAEAELAPLRDRQRFHHTEFWAFMYAQVRLFHASGNSAAARSWFDLWDRLNPDDPLLGRARRLLDPRLRAFGRMFDELLPPE